MGYREVASIAFVQKYGLMESKNNPFSPVEIQAFADNGDDADLKWVIDIVREAHGDEPFVYAADVEFKKASDGVPNIVSYKHSHFWVTSPGGPTWGEVIRL